MFALAGSLMARSLKRPAMGVIRGRVRRLLPPMWAFAAVVLAMMFMNGWNPTDDPERGGTWGSDRAVQLHRADRRAALPLAHRLQSGLLEDTWAVQAAGPLWYLRAYLWFVIASPLLLWLFRKAPWPTLLAPLGLTAIVGRAW
ncbi:acyltransferase [Streptomyces thinghirensis]|nr:acyltransferase [Streptomyces thinghirensis]